MYYGFSKINITPETPVPLDGYINRENGHSFKGVLDPLRARILVLKNETRQAVFITLDLTGITYEFYSALRARVKRFSSLETELIISCTHTHSAPRGFTTYPDTDKKLRKIATDVLDKIAKGVKTELENLGTSNEASFGFGMVEIEGLSSTRLNPEKEIDRLIRTLVVRDANDKTLKGCLSNFACHPTVLGPGNYHISGDLFGLAADKVEKRYPSMTCLMTNGAEGDISTRFSRERRDYKELTRLSDQLGRGIIDSIENSTAIEDDGLDWSLTEVELSQTSNPDLTKVKKKLARARKKLTDLRSEGSYSQGELRRFESRVEGLRFLRKQLQKGGLKESVTITLMAFRVGSIIFIAIPGELFNESFNSISNWAPRGINLVPLGLSNGYSGYFPIDNNKEDTYEELVSNYDHLSTKQLKAGITSLIYDLIN